MNGRREMAELARRVEADGWSTTITRGGHLRFTRPGCAPVFTSQTPSDHRAIRNTVAQLRRSASAVAS